MYVDILATKKYYTSLNFSLKKKKNKKNIDFYKKPSVDI